MFTIIVIKLIFTFWRFCRLDSWLYPFMILITHITGTTTKIKSFIEHKTQDRECELYNSTNCAKDSGDCDMKRGFCKDADLDKPSNCFVLWSIDNQTGEVKHPFIDTFTSPV